MTSIRPGSTLPTATVTVLSVLNPCLRFNDAQNTTHSGFTGGDIGSVVAGIGAVALLTLVILLLLKLRNNRARTETVYN